MIKVGIVGGTGYTGVELLRLLSQHPNVEVDVITSRAESGKPVHQLFTNLRGHIDIAFSNPLGETFADCDLVFFATPHGVAQDKMPELIGAGKRVIDLSADFRIRDKGLWERWYNQQHACPDLIDRAVYGLPEVNREAIKQAQLVACPGCYPTSIQLGLLPLLEEGLIDTKSIIANSASGASGAGRQAKVNLIHSEISDSFSAYGVGGHRHLPEIEQGLADIAAKSLKAEEKSEIAVTFVPHLLPILRGIHSTIYAKLNTAKQDLQALYSQRYSQEAFVDVLPHGHFPQTRTVRGTNLCRISVMEPQERDTVVIMSAIDNLTKGASGQAVQNMNIMFGWDEDTGLNAPALLP